MNTPIHPRSAMRQTAAQVPRVETIDRDIITCPACGCECVHPERVRVYPIGGDTEYEITRAGLQIGPSEAAARQRGASIVLNLACEEGHTWSEELRFHKGTTLHRTHVSCAERDPEDWWPETLWRN